MYFDDPLIRTLQDDRTHKDIATLLQIFSKTTIMLMVVLENIYIYIITITILRTQHN